MIRIRFIVLISVFFFVHSAKAQERKIPVYNFNEVEKYLNYNNDSTYVINFWATWCIPCRKELPAFQKIHDEFASSKVKVFLVSLDFPNQVETVLKPFLLKNKITAEVIILDDPNSNNWIDIVDSSWSGSLPATLIYNSASRQFFEKEFTEETLKDLLLKTLETKKL